MGADGAVIFAGFDCSSLRGNDGGSTGGDTGDSGGDGASGGGGGRCSRTATILSPPTPRPRARTRVRTAPYASPEVQSVS